MEIDSYVGEMSGKPKEKETLLGFLRSLKRLRENFGHVHVNIGEPIALSPLLDEHQPEWRDYIGQEGGAPPSVPRWMCWPSRSCATSMRRRRSRRSTCWHWSCWPPSARLCRKHELRAQLALCLELLRSAPYSLRVTATPLDADGVIAAGFKARILHRSGADIIGLAARHAAAMTWYRNNCAACVRNAVPAGLLLSIRTRRWNPPCCRG
jgi:glycerol-3-phosphate O-acyltransferase